MKSKKMRIVLLAIIIFCASIFFSGCVKSLSINNQIAYGLLFLENQEYEVEEVLYFKLQEDDEKYANVDSINEKISTLMNRTLTDMKNNYFSHFLTSSYSMFDLTNYFNENIKVSNVTISENKAVCCYIAYKTIESFSVFHCKQDLLHIEKEDEENIPTDLVYEQGLLYTKQIEYLYNPFGSSMYNLGSIFVKKYNNSTSININNVDYIYELGVQDSRCYSNATNTYYSNGAKVHQWIFSDLENDGELFLYYTIFNQYVWYGFVLAFSLLLVFVLNLKNIKSYTRLKNIKKINRKTVEI